MFLNHWRHDHGINDSSLQTSERSCSYLVRLLFQQALAAAVGGAVLHLARVALLEPRRHQTPTHRRQHALIHGGLLSDTDKAGVNYRSQIKSNSSLPVYLWHRGRWRHINGARPIPFSESHFSDFNTLNTSNCSAFLKHRTVGFSRFPDSVHWPCLQVTVTWHVKSGVFFLLLVTMAARHDIYICIKVSHPHTVTHSQSSKNTTRLEPCCIGPNARASTTTSEVQALCIDLELV